MVVTLAKGGNVSLSNEAPNLTAVRVGLGWDVRVTTGADFDLDASALACGENKRVLSDDHFVFYGSKFRTHEGLPQSPDGSIECGPDNSDGSGDGDDEYIKVNLPAVPADITNIVFPVSIHEAHIRGQSFGQVSNAYVRVVDEITGSELARYDLGEDASTETAIVFGELYRRNDEWKFRAIGQGYASGLAGIARDYGVNVG